MSSSGDATKRRRLNTGGAASSSSSSSLRVAFVGRKGAFCENAMKTYFRSSAGAGVASPGKVRMTRPVVGVPTHSAALVAAAVASGEADFGVLPMESNVSGYIRATEDALISCDNVFIVGETIYSENHCLVAQAGVELATINRVTSHSHILQQCSTVIESLGADTFSCSGSAAACALIAEGAESMKDCAAIASREAAQAHGLVVLQESVGNKGKPCMTRYVVIAGSEGEGYKGLHAKVALKSSVIVFLNNKAGAMFRALSCFALRDINVTQVSCRPSPMTASHGNSSLFEYCFLLTYEPNNTTQGFAAAKEALRNLEEYSLRVKNLGTYVHAAANDTERESMAAATLHTALF